MVRPPVVLLFGAALVLRLALLPAPGNTSDISGLSGFASHVAFRGPASLYDDPLAFGEQYIIPPLFPLLLGAAFRVWAALSGTEPSFPVASAMVKCFGLVGDLGVGALIHRWVAARAGARWALGSAAAFLFGPGLVYDTAWWGQIESLLVLCIAGALVALAAGHVGLAWVIVGAGVLLKPQVAVSVPLLGWLTLRAHGLRALAVGAAASAAVVVALTAPYWATGRALLLITSYAGAVDYYPRLSVNADNLWRALAGPGGAFAGSPDTLSSPLGPSYRQLGLAMLGAYLLLVLWRVRPRDDESWPAAAAALYLAFFMLPTQIHERYLYPAVALLCFGLYRRPGLLALHAVLGIGLFANLVRVVPWDARAPAALAAVGLGSWQVSLAHTTAFGWMTARVLLGLGVRWLAPAAAVAAAGAAVVVQTAPPNW